MGYVLPVSPFQSQDYQKRVTRDKQNRFYIERPYKTILESHYHDIRKMDSRHTTVAKKRKEGNTKVPEPAEHAYADFTGKGRFFNESI
ncbi:hypothetical protein WMZ97_03910 [Lentibacillus sp. N15]|uniref:hypothetical protein n=1 Tax=Lentibacillus songyuanensis TaxID=3136161 RepID=UPI0031BAC07F